MNRKRIEDVEVTAKNLIIKYNIKNPPTPVEKLAQYEGVSLVSHDFGDNVSGVLVMKDGKGMIGYSANDPKVRKRFTIAHELGHYILHGDSSSKEEVFVDKDFIIKYRNNVNSYNKVEIKQENEANAFAAALLMPKFLIEEEFRNNDFSNLSEPDLIKYLAKKFEVSVLAMTYRLSNLNIF